MNSKNYTPIRNPPTRERGRLVRFGAAADDACTMTAALARDWEKVAVEVEVSLVRAVPYGAAVLAAARSGRAR